MHNPRSSVWLAASASCFAIAGGHLAVFRRRRITSGLSASRKRPSWASLSFKVPASLPFPVCTVASAKHRTEPRDLQTVSEDRPFRFAAAALILLPVSRDRIPPLHRSDIRSVYSRKTRFQALLRDTGCYTCISRSVLTVSHRSDGFFRFRPASLLHPAAGPGVRLVSHRIRLILHRPKPAVDQSVQDDSRGADYPSKKTPLA